MSSMTRVAFLFPIMLAAGATSSTAQVPAQRPVVQRPIVQQPVYTPPSVSLAAVNNSLAEWRRLRQGGNFSFTDYARLLVYNPDWPGESALRRSAERVMRPGENPALVIAFFREEKPFQRRLLTFRFRKA